MSRLTQFAASVVAGVVLVAPMSVYSAADNQDHIDYRLHVMNTIDAQAKAIAMIIEQRAPADNLAVHAQTLALAASTAVKAFTPNAPGAKAKPEVWAKFDDFSKRMTEFAANTEDLAKAAQTGGAAAVKPKLRAAFAPCKSCHDLYRDEKK